MTHVKRISSERAGKIKDACTSANETKNTQEIMNHVKRICSERAGEIKERCVYEYK